MSKLLRKLPLRIVIRRYEAILVGSVLLLSGAVIPSSWDPPVQTIPRPVIHPLNHPWIALTFDDGPHPVMTEKLLRVLKEGNVPGTFFVVGKMAERYPQLVREIVADGNEIANHTYTHTRLSRLDDTTILSELAQTRAVIQRLTGRDSLLFRPPGGAFTRRTLRATSEAGYKMVLWSILTKDVQGASAEAIEHRIMRGAEDGAIVLMHSGMPHTVDVLPDVIAKLKKKGYHFVTMSQLLGYEPAPEVPADNAPVQTAQRPLTQSETRLQ